MKMKTKAFAVIGAALIVQVLAAHPGLAGNARNNGKGSYEAKPEAAAAEAKKGSVSPNSTPKKKKANH